MQDQMDENQLRLLSMYGDISEILNSHHIRFYMGYGSALGAVRHSGFIPWDNDIDLLVWEDDLPAIKKAFAESLDPEKYYYHEPKADTHPHVILKEGDFEKNLKDKAAPFIDIFPLVRYPDRKFRKCLSFLTIGSMQAVITAMDRVGSHLFYKCARWTVPVLKKLSEILRNEDTKDVTVLSTTFYREVCPAAYFGKPSLHPFENTEAPLPKEYDRILRDYYGDYMELPPENKRTGATGYPCCVYFDYLSEKKKENDGSKIVICRRPREDSNGKTGLGRYADMLESCLKNVPYDVVEADVNSSHGIVNLILNGIIRPIKNARRIDTPSTVFHAADELCSVIFPFVRGRKIMTVHHVSFREGRFDLFYRMWMHITKTGIRHSDRIIAISETTKHDLIAIGCPEDKIDVIVNGIDPKFEKRDVPKEKGVFCMGQLAPRKNMQDAMRAFTILSGYEGMGDCTLTFCGDGPDRAELESMAEEAGVSDRVRIVSGISEDEMVDLYNRNMVVFNTSLLEGTGLVTLESQRCGTPVLHLNRAKIPEAVTKMSVGCDSPEDMAKKAYELMTDPVKYKELSEKSREYAVSFGGDFKKRYLALLEKSKTSGKPDTDCRFRKRIQSQKIFPKTEDSLRGIASSSMNFSFFVRPKRMAR